MILLLRLATMTFSLPKVQMVGIASRSTENLSKTNGTSRFQKMATSSQNTVYLAWADVNNTNNLSSQGFDIFFTKSADGGNSFGKIINLSSNNNENTNNNNTHSLFNPQLARFRKQCICGMAGG